MVRYGRKSYRSTKRTGRRAVSVKTVRKVARKEVLRAVETKELVYPYNSGTLQNFTSISYGSGAGYARVCLPIAQGVGNGQRVGNSIYLRGIYINLPIQNGDSHNNMRLLVVTPKRDIPDGTVAEWVQDVLSNTPSGSTQWAAPVDTDKYHVLYDKHRFVYATPQDGSSANVVPHTFFFKKFLKINKKITWVNDVPTASERTIRDYIILLVSDSTVVPHAGCIAGFVKLYFKDA